MSAFVATSGPANWKLGKWSQVNTTTWQEQKFDNPKIVYQFQVVNGPGSSNTIRLKMVDQNTEVMLLESTALIFVNGSYFGEYSGEWQYEQSGYAPAVQQPVQGSTKNAPPGTKTVGPPSAPNEIPGNKVTPGNENRGSIPGTKGVTQTQPMQQTQLPPGRKSGPGGGPPPATNKSAPLAIETPSPMPSNPNRRQKAEGLDKSPDKINKLIDAAKNGDVATVKQLLDSGVDPDGPAKDGRTPLMAAASSGSLKVIEALVEACADPTLGKGSETPLTIAFQKGNQDVLKALFAASFQTLDGVIGPGVVYDPRYSLSQIAAGSDDVPQSAIDDLREVTSKLAHMNRDNSSSSPTGGKYGNYSDMMATCETDDKDSDMLREEAVRLAMKSLVKTTKDIKEIETNLH